MFHGFKNSEYLKFEIDTKIDLEMSKIKKSTLNSYTSVVASIFASFFSEVLLSFLQTFIIIDNPVAKCFAYLGIFVAGVIISFIVFYFLIKKITTFINDRKIYRLGETEKHEIIERFDNVACDSVIVAQNYKKYILELNQGDSETKYLRDFYLYEIIHYLNKATGITIALLSEEDSCVTTENDNQKVDQFRIKNLVQFMIDHFKFINKYIDDQTDDVKKAIQNLKQKLIELQSKLKIDILK